MQIHELPQLATPEASNVVAVDTGTANYKVPLGNLMTNVVNNLTTTESGYALDARQGKVLNESIGTLAGNIAAIETSPTVSAHTAGDYIFYNGTLYKVTVNISAGATLTVGTNITQITVMDALIAQGAAPFMVKDITLTPDGYTSSPPAIFTVDYPFTDRSTVGYTPIAFIPTSFSYVDALTRYQWHDANTTTNYDSLTVEWFSYEDYNQHYNRSVQLTIVFVPDSMIR